MSDGVYIRQNTLRDASVEFVRQQRANYARGSTRLFQTENQRSVFRLRACIDEAAKQDSAAGSCVPPQRSHLPAVRTVLELCECVPSTAKNRPKMIERSSKILRRILPAGDVPGSEEFLRCARDFFAGILTYFSADAARDDPLSGCVGSWKNTPKYNVRRRGTVSPPSARCAFILRLKETGARRSARPRRSSDRRHAARRLRA